MDVVNSVEEFVKRNENDLRRYMIFKTGIFDKNLVDEAIQEFYVKLIETKALETYDEDEGAFSTYITNLFCWTLPGLRNKNFRINFDVLSSVSVGTGYDARRMDIWDVIYMRSNRVSKFKPKKPASKREEIRTSTEASNPRISFNVEASFPCPALDNMNEDLFIRELENFKDYIKKTESKRNAKRMILYIDRKLDGCLSVDIAKMLKVSTTMVRIIKRELRYKYLKWKKKSA